MGKSRKIETVPGLPESWSFSNWPAAVWPGDGRKAQWVGRAYRKELIAAGALARVGNALVFRRAGYERWLDTRAARVEDFAPRNPSLNRSAPGAQA